MVDRDKDAADHALWVEALEGRCDAEWALWLWQPLIEAGAEVRLFNPPKVLKLRASLLNFRTHRKIVVIDGTTAFTGGLNVSATSSGSARPRPRTTVTPLPPRPLVSKNTRTTPSVGGATAFLQRHCATGWRQAGHMRPASVE
jgi:phosphatidylserine/phosphatidylglycerophosphate/cardiolipin synthase-like enzyme